MNIQESIFNEAKDLYMSGRYEKAIELFTKAQSKGCNPVSVYLSRGAAYLNIGNFAKAIEDFDKILEIDTGNERAFYFRGMAKMVGEKYEEAMFDLTTSIELNSQRGAAFLARGLCYAELDCDEESARDLKTALAFSNVEIEKFTNMFGENRTFLDKSIAALEGDRGPWKFLLDTTEIQKLQKWLQ